MKPDKNKTKTKGVHTLKRHFTFSRFIHAFIVISLLLKKENNKEKRDENGAKFIIIIKNGKGGKFNKHSTN